jgi:hypothetical protein
MRPRDPSPELGNLVLFEHVNLRVPDHRLATLYFVEGLGLTRDPLRMVGTRNMWVNAGLQQFHLPIGDPTPLPGEVGVVVPDLDAVEARLEAVARELKGTAFTLERAAGTLRTTTPWGHRVRVHARAAVPGWVPQALAYVEFWVPPGSAAGIGAFYQTVLGCPAEAVPIEGDPAVAVTVGPGQTFRFRERPDGAIVPNTNHVAVYLTRYRSIYAAITARDLVMEADADEQFRFQDIVDPATGARLYRFEHEMRSLHHRGYRRPLVNRVLVPWEVD